MLNTEQMMVFTGKRIGLLLWVGPWPETAVRPPQRSRVSLPQPFMHFSGQSRCWAGSCPYHL